jgi:hypothetical protein
VEHAGETEDMVAVKMADEDSHFPIDARPRLKKLALSPLPTIEKEKLRPTPYQHAWKVPKLVRNTSARAEKCD